MSEKTVLIVDDELSILNSLTRLLRKEPYQLLTTASAQEALEMMAKQPVHVIISDQKMPSMEGTELLQKVKEQYPETVRVILSGHADINLLIDSINKNEVYRFLTKPWNDHEVKAVIRQSLTHYDLAQKNRVIMEDNRFKNTQPNL